MDGLILVPLNERKDLLSDCVELLNNQWPRSKVARLRSLEQRFGEDEFPVSLLLLEPTKDKCRDHLIGHSKILPVPYDREKCFVESVVISNELRGKGYGRRIMQLTEAYAKQRGIKFMHLTTHDQQGFYKKLGYEHCDPIVVFGGCSQNIQKLPQSMEISSGPNQNSGQDFVKRESEESEEEPREEKASLAEMNPSVAAPLPPPPPLPLQSSQTHEKVQILYRPDGAPQSAITGLKMHMRKELT
jgi:GNAT superfamily N-acetyltransferase